MEQDKYTQSALKELNSAIQSIHESQEYIQKGNCVRADSALDRARDSVAAVQMYLKYLKKG